MRSTLRRAERCWQKISDRYGEYLRSLNDEDFAQEFRRHFPGMTKEQVLDYLNTPGEQRDAEMASGLSKYLDKAFGGERAAMKRNFTSRLQRLEAEAEERARPNYAILSEEERYYRIMLLVAKAKKRKEDGRVNPNPTDPEESRRRIEQFQRMQPRLQAAESSIKLEAQRMGLSTEEYLRRRFPWVSYSGR